jgi:glycosyltransferase involved in cell wall biosynthesis
MTNPRVSVCIPTYSRAAELEQAIESVLGQSFPDFELIVGDDSGTGALEGVVRRFNDPRIRYVRHERNFGMGENWNQCLDRARGRLLTLLMDDDRWLPRFLEATVQAFDEDPTLGVVFTNHYFEENGRLRLRDCPVLPGRYAAFLPLALRFKPAPASATVLTQDVWKAVRPMPNLLTADVILQLRAAVTGSVFRYLDEPLMIYRCHPGQLSRTMWPLDDAIQLWSMFRFDDPGLEKIRQANLGEIQVRRAARSIRSATYQEARAAGAAARAIRDAQLTRRDRCIVFLACHPGLARFVHLVWNGLHRADNLVKQLRPVAHGRGL